MLIVGVVGLARELRFLGQQFVQTRRGRWLIFSQSRHVNFSRTVSMTVWLDEHTAWQKRDLSAKRYVYIRADGIHLEARLEDEKQCILVLIGATPEGCKKLVGFTDGSRESAHDWRDLLLDVKRRGLDVPPRLVIADGALGFWKAAGEVWPKTREQRCWVHKTANVLGKLPKSQHPKAKRALQEIWMTETKAAAELAFDAFIESYAPKYEKAADCLSKDRDTLLAFYDFPAEHWKHLRTTNPIESTFATVRHRTIRSKCYLSNRTALAMVFKLLEAAHKSWCRLDGHNQLPKLVLGVTFNDGMRSSLNRLSALHYKQEVRTDSHRILWQGQNNQTIVVSSIASVIASTFHMALGLAVSIVGVCLLAACKVGNAYCKRKWLLRRNSTPKPQASGANN